MHPVMLSVRFGSAESVVLTDSAPPNLALRRLCIHMGPLLLTYNIC